MTTTQELLKSSFELNLNNYGPEDVERLKEEITRLHEDAAGASPVEPSQAPQGCACRWDAEDNRIATCTRHQGWLDVVQEWADRAKAAEAKLAQPPAPSDTAITYMTGYSDCKEWTQPSQADAQDAARYRWLRSTTNWASNSSNERIDVRNSPELWDAAVDAAIQKELTP